MKIFSFVYDKNLEVIYFVVKKKTVGIDVFFNFEEMCYFDNDAEFGNDVEL